MRLTIWLLALCLLPAGTTAQEDAEKKVPAGAKATAEEEEPLDPARNIIRQKTRLLRACPKRYAVFKAAVPSRGEVELVMEGETDSRVWKIEPDAEVKVHGFWGRLEELQAGDRVWAWIRLDRKERPVTLFMLADEISEEVIHGLPYALRSFDAAERTIVVERKDDEPRTLSLDDSLNARREDGALVVAAAAESAPHQPAATLRTGDPVYVQTTDGSARIVVGSEGLGVLRERQRSRLRERWRREGIPASVGLLHRFAGEVEVALDHEGMRWGRHLQRGDLVDIHLADPVRAVVLDAAPWQERTRLRLAARGGSLSELSSGRRVLVRIPEPPAEVAAARLPPDTGRARSGAARIDWFLSSTYCSCSIAGDGCTGMFYTLASCNPETCGMPNRIRARVGELVEEGLTDREIFAKLEEERGELIHAPHLLR